MGNGGFTLATDEGKGIQLGLRASERVGVDVVANGAAGTYFARLGLAPPPGRLTATTIVDSVILEVDFDPAVNRKNFVSVDVFAETIASGGAVDPLLIQDATSRAPSRSTWSSCPDRGPVRRCPTAWRGVLFSPTTAVFLGDDVFVGGDIVAWDGADFTLLFDGTLFSTTPPPEIDAVTQLPSGNLLISTVLSGTLFGLDFKNGDVIEVDLADGTASVFLAEATIFTGANPDIDALHYDAARNSLILSVRSGAVGTIGGFAYRPADDIHADLVELDLNGGIAGSLFLDGRELFDGAPRQIDAVYVSPPMNQVRALGRLGTWVLHAGSRAG